VGALKRKERNMQMRVDRLREVLKLVQPVIPKKTALPVLKNFLIKDGKAMATDQDIMVILDLPEAEGECLIPHHSAKAFLDYVPGYETLSIEQTGKTIEFSWEGGKASYETESPKEYPSVPELKERARGSIDGDRLVSAMMSIIEYCSHDQTRPVLSGLSLSLGETIELAAGDGFRMAYQILPLSFPAEDRVIIPSGSVWIIGDLWSKVPPAVPLADSLISQVIAKRQIELALGNILMAHFGRVTLLIRLIEGSAPNFKQLIPKEPPITIRVFAPELERAVRRCAEVATNNSGIIRFDWSETDMTVSAKSGDTISVEAKVPVQIEGGSGRVAANVSYLLHYLKGKNGLVSIGVTSSTSPILLRHGTSPLVVIMPMYAGEKAKVAEPVTAEAKPAGPVPKAEPETKVEAKVKVKTKKKAK
jgi:DNA polymerase-3 subunit beta